MRVQICNVKCLLGKDLVDIYPCLKKYDYKCQSFEKENIYGQKYTFCDRSVKISSLKELLKLKKDVDTDIIIEVSLKYPFRITIYDDCIE